MYINFIHTVHVIAQLVRVLTVVHTIINYTVYTIIVKSVIFKVLSATPVYLLFFVDMDDTAIPNLEQL